MDEFETDDGRPVPAVTAAVMGEVDRVAVEETGPQLLSMMENAGRNLAGAAREAADGDGPIAVLAGGGGNGGGGLAAARHLATGGREVRVVLDRPPGELGGATATQWATLSAMDVAPAEPEAALSGAAVAVDAVLGYGLAGAPRGRAAELVEAVEGFDGPTLSLDVPSGVDATTGERPGAAVAPDRTLTLALPKTGLAAAEGELALGHIGIPAVVFERAGVDYRSPFDGRYRVPLVRG